MLDAKEYAARLVDMSLAELMKERLVRLVEIDKLVLINSEIEKRTSKSYLRRIEFTEKGTENED